LCRSGKEIEKERRENKREAVAAAGFFLWPFNPTTSPLSPEGEKERKKKEGRKEKSLLLFRRRQKEGEKIN
jgi:hypothetical protein